MLLFSFDLIFFVCERGRGMNGENCMDGFKQDGKNVELKKKEEKEKE